MTGLVLCGGQSSRMGADKGLIKYEASPWAQIAYDKLDTLHIPVFFSVNKNQYQQYAAIFPSCNLIADNEQLQIKGPLLGLLSAHLLFPGEDILVLACDMPLMDISVLQQLRDAYLTNTTAQAFVFSNNNEPEPLCGIYKATGLTAIHSMYQSQQLAKHSMKFMLEHITTYTIALTEEQKQFFRNFNAHAELNGL